MLTLEQVIERYPIPFELEELQKIDIVRGATWRRVLLDLPVGYGKSVISTCISLMLQPETTVVLMPPILIAQWKVWLDSITGKGSCVAYFGSPRQRADMPLRGARWICASYQIFNNDIERFRKELASADVLTVVDECQNVKGLGVLFKNVRAFTSGRDLVLMSGTLMSKPGDAYAYIKLLTPEIYSSRTQFENIHVEERDFFKQPKKWGNLDLLQTNLNMRRVARTKEEVHAALPKARYIPTHYRLDKDHMALYRRLMDEQLLTLDDGGKIDATTATRLYHAAQQIIANYGHFAGDDSKRPATFDLIDQIIAEADILNVEKSKLIIWTQYRMTSARLLQYLGDVAVAAYSGADSKRSVAAFLEDPAVRILVAHPKSAGMGLNPAHLCSECLFIETPTTTIDFVQSAGRIDRKGQRFNPNIRIAIAEGTIQEQLHQNLLTNDALVARASGSPVDLRAAIYGGGS